MALVILVMIPFVYGVEHIKSMDKKNKSIILNDTACIIMYVYKSTPCPNIEDIFRKLEQVSGNDYKWIIMPAHNAQPLLGEEIKQFPALFFIKNGTIKMRMSGQRPSLEQVKKYITQL